MIGHDNTVAMNVKEATLLRNLLLDEIVSNLTLEVIVPSVLALLERLKYRISQGD